MSELNKGSEFAGHRIDGVAGQGGMGVVYVATHLALDITVALKLIKPDLAEDEGFRERFNRESRLAASIEHPNVLPVRHAGEEEGLLYITMRYVDGTDLRSLIDRTGRIEPERTAQIITQVGDALDAAHARGLVHRDVKPANVLLEGADGSGHAYLTDFGLTRHAASGAGLTKTGQWVGTLDYVAPEQIEGREVDARSDVYALGCVVYEMLTGEVPFLKDSEVATMYAHLNEPAVPPRERFPDLPRGIDEVVNRALAKDPDDRYPSAGDLATAVVAATKGTAVAQPEQSVAAGRAAPPPAPSPPPPGETAAARPSMPAPAPPPPQPTRGAPPPTRGAPPPAPPRAPTPTPAIGTPPPPGARPPGAPPPAKKSSRRRGLIAGVAVVAVLGVGAGALFATGVIGGSDDEPSSGPSETEDDGEEMAAEEEAAAEETVNSYRDAFGSEAQSTIETLLAPDATYTYLGFDSLPVSDELRDLFEAVNPTDYQLTVNSMEYEEGSDPAAVNAELAYDYTPFGNYERNSGIVEWRLERESEDGDYKIVDVAARPDFYQYYDVSAPPTEYTIDLFEGRTNKIGETSGNLQQDGKRIPIRIPADPVVAPDIDGSQDLRVVASFREEAGPSTDTSKIGYPYAS